MISASSQEEAKLSSVFKTPYATRERENRSHFLCIFPIDTPQKVCYNCGASMFRASAEFPVYHRLRQFVKQNLVKKLHKKSPAIKVIFVLDKQKYFLYNVFTRLRKSTCFLKKKIKKVLDKPSKKSYNKDIRNKGSVLKARCGKLLC